MTEENEQYAYFTIIGSFKPSDITARVGAEPTKSWQKGDLHPKTRYERRFSRWSLFSRLDRTVALEDHIRDVIAQLDVNQEAFKVVSREFGGCMQLVGYFYEQYPGLHFEKDIVEGLAKYSLSVDFDFYYLYSDGREDTGA